jgi:DNA-binding LacI/PurR family transcriptional regulator
MMEQTNWNIMGRVGFFEKIETGPRLPGCRSTSGTQVNFVAFPQEPKCLPTCLFSSQLLAMSEKPLCSITDQVVERLRCGMAEGRWHQTLPGRKALAAQLGCSPWTVEEAMQRLGKEGLLVSQGAGSRRRIVLSEGVARPRALRVMILLYEPSDRNANYMVDLLHRLRDAGHEAIFAEKTMRELGMNVKRIARFVEGSAADAWVVFAGSRDILEWFAGRETPAFALFGRNSKSPLASHSLRKAEALVELADQLVDLGHRRIVILSREERRKPTPAFLEQVFLDRLVERGVPTGPYNLPDWGDNPRAFRQILDSLFRYTPPTALIVDQPSLCVAVLQHLSRLGLTVPADVSLACTDSSDAFEWCDPRMAHISWELRPVIKRVVKWAENISRGKADRHKGSSKVRLLLGGTISAVPKARKSS